VVSIVIAYHHLPCTRYDKDLGFGVCEATTQAGSDVCSRFVLRSNVCESSFLAERRWVKLFLGDVMGLRVMNK
jgi:hypothetical protein